MAKKWSPSQRAAAARELRQLGWQPRKRVMSYKTSTLKAQLRGYRAQEAAGVPKEQRTASVGRRHAKVEGGRPVKTTPEHRQFWHIPAKGKRREQWGVKERANEEWYASDLRAALGKIKGVKVAISVVGVIKAGRTQGGRPTIDTLTRLSPDLSKATPAAREEWEPDRVEVTGGAAIGKATFELMIDEHTEGGKVDIVGLMNHAAPSEDGEWGEIYWVTIAEGTMTRSKR